MFILWLVEFIIRTIPEALLFIGASFVLTRTKINKKNIVISSCIFVGSPYVARLLPIDYGIHSLLLLVFLSFLNVKINKIKSIESIKASVFIFIIMFVSEYINILFIQVILKLDMNEIFKNPLMRPISGVPSLFIFALVIFVVHKLSKKPLNQKNNK